MEWFNRLFTVNNWSRECPPTADVALEVNLSVLQWRFPSR
jgi:hypothetical protein